jgi:hypothetical protein
MPGAPDRPRFRSDEDTTARQYERAVLRAQARRQIEGYRAIEQHGLAGWVLLAIPIVAPTFEERLSRARQWIVTKPWVVGDATHRREVVLRNIRRLRRQHRETFAAERRGDRCAYAGIDGRLMDRLVYTDAGETI